MRKAKAGDKAMLVGALEGVYLGPFLISQRPCKHNGKIVDVLSDPRVLACECGCGASTECNLVVMPSGKEEECNTNWLLPIDPPSVAKEQFEERERNVPA